MSEYLHQNFRLFMCLFLIDFQSVIEGSIKLFPLVCSNKFCPQVFANIINIIMYSLYVSSVKNN